MYPVRTIPDNAPILTEPLGTKRKFWFDGYRFLFKEARPNTGEDWSEKVVCELCRLLELPHAEYDFAVWKGRRGVVTQNFAQREDGKRLILGNELLFKLDPGYPERERRGVRQHTVRRAMAVASLDGVRPPVGFVTLPSIESAADVFAGYLMLDAWVANQDRHHENWGLVLHIQDGAKHLTPSFDHASSLGPFETEETRAERLVTRDKARSMERYVEKARSAFYTSESSAKPTPTLDAFLAAARIRPKAALAWLKKLEGISEHQIEAVINEVANDRMSDTTKRFATRILDLNRSRLLSCVGMLLA